MIKPNNTILTFAALVFFGGVATADEHGHMHHKFAVFDGKIVVSGSYNWTRSAAEDNEENIVVTNEQKIVQSFHEQFGRLWTQMQPIVR